MKFSIIIPVYNSSVYLKRCIDSILNQTYKELEIILVNDGSTDDSGTICEEFASKENRIKVIHQKNSGTSQARNTGLNFSVGDYVLFMDNDDYWTTNDGLYKIASQLKESQADVLIFDAAIEYDSGVNHKGISNFQRDRILGKSPEIALAELIENNKLVRAVWTKVIKNTLIQENNIQFPVGKRNEDTDFTAQLILVAKSYDWFNYYFYTWVKTGISQSSTRVSYQSMKDLEYILISNIKKSETISNVELKEDFLSYLAYPYSVLIGQAKEFQKRKKSKDSKEIIYNLKKYQFVLNSDKNPNIKLLKKIYNIFGFRLVVWLLGIMMEKTYKKQGA
ncbi:hypothetical protein B9W73_01485 [Lactococcus lactis]|uniref:glycosyltransferase family 2 protein n=1 Tax=Lactococcus lactis TaxID=1358 RepID=UPI00071E0090|nr:glycosyltransferase [Lactococcus lactis]KST86010.1 Beta-13-glucosyltransferase [Lactococcus lactis subsp. lactis]OSP88037.1 hypothetical protein B9W73_01485 [Lactococcus lactis]